MGAGNILGLLLEINADSSKGDAAVQAFAERTGQSVGMVTAQVKEYQEAETAAYDEALRRMRGAGQELDESLLNNTQSVRLFASEFGIGLPRQVSSAIAKMLPEIAGMGTALLAVFAVEEAVKFAKALKNLADEASGVAEAEKEMKKAGDENISLLEELAKKNRDLAHSEATRFLAEAAGMSAGIEQLKQQIDIDAEFSGGLGMLIDKIRGKYKDLAQAQAEQNKLVELAAKFNKIFAEDEEAGRKKAVKDAKDAAEEQYKAAMQKYEANQKAYHASEEGLKRLMALQDHLGRQTVEEADRAVKAREREARAIKELGDKLDAIAAKEARNAEELGKEASRQIADIERLGNEQERAALRGKEEARQRIQDQHREAVAAIQSHNQQAQAIAALKGDYKAMADAAIAAYTAMGQASANYLRQLHEQHEEEEKADHEATNAAIAEVGALAEGAAQLAGSKKGYYAVKAGEEVAAGIECIAEGTWPPNPLALIAAGVHFESAGLWAKLAGTSAARPGTGAGSVGGEFATPGGGEYRGQGTGDRGQGTDYGERPLAGTGLAPGAAGPSGGRVSVYLFADSMELGRSMATHINNYVVTGGGELTASRALRSAPAQG